MGAPLRRARAQRRIGLGLACAALAGLAVVLWRGDVDSPGTATWISVVSALVSAFAFVADLLNGPDDRDPLDGAGRGPRAADALAEAVRSQWDAEAQLRRLQDPEPLCVRWSRVGPPLADHPGNVHRGRPVPPPRDGDQQLDRVVEAFAAVPSRRLVVLGGPGAGKSILAVQFVLGMLAARRRGGPVPVFFPLAGWNPQALTLRAWLAERLSAEYPALAASDGDSVLAHGLLRAGLVLPVLDGFDELPPPVQGEAMRRLNGELDERLPVLLTCRTTAWTRAVEAGDVLTAAEVVELRRLDFGTARHYLERTARPDGRGSTSWTPVLEAPPGPLTEVLGTPLMVALARTVYGDTSRDPAELLDAARFPTAESIEEHLLDAFVPAAFGDAPGSTWRPDAAHRWLRRLARDLDGGDPGRHRDGGRHGPDRDGQDRRRGTWRLAWWELPDAMPKALRVIGPALLALLATAALLVPLAWFGNGVVGEWDSSLSMVLHLTGVLVGLCCGFARLLPGTADTPQGPRRLARMAVTLTAIAAPLAAVCGLLAPPLFGLRLGDAVTPRPIWFFNGCAFGLILSMLFAVAGLPRRPPPLGLPWAGSASGPGAVRALAAGLTFAVPVLLVVRLVVPATICFVAGLLLFLAGQRHGERAAAPFTGPAAVLRGFGTGLLRGFLVCSLIGVSVSAVVGGVVGAFAAYEVRSAPSLTDGQRVGGWYVRESPDGIRTVDSAKPYAGELLPRGPHLKPLAVPRRSRIAHNGRTPHPFHQPVRIRMEHGGPVLHAAGRPPADAWNVVTELPHDVRLWLAYRSAPSVIGDVVVPLAEFGVLIGAIGGCASGVYRALSTPSDTLRAAGPQSTLRTDRAATAARSAIAAVLAGGVCLALIRLVGNGGALGTMHTELWVPLGTSALALSAWGRLGAARIWLAVTGRAPWRLMAFLEEAHRRGVLRQSGAHYEFRHLRLQQRLAGAADDDERRVPAPVA
ncbi:NACHT domain-containing protein [Streptomyces sp. URMC 124]|uniref:NACHT domain-containing protein n=1 Tax=Streptomyces sp. URMC 124 TaxID=3423405 RepID=UPI003F1CB582